MRPTRHLLAGALTILASLGSLDSTRTFSQPQSDQTSNQKTGAPLDDRAIGTAICPVVYRVDEFPSPRGFHYLFYGNGFFINKDGYLLTAAHVLSQLHGGQPYVLLRSPSAPPHFAQAAVVALDRDHDIAILRATPNPFDNGDTVSFLPLSHEMPASGQTVLAAALRPLNPRDSYTLDPSFQERPSGGVLGFEFSQLDKGRPDTELFLFNHAIRPGQSGAPVLSLDSHEVVGLVEGQWLRDNSMALAAPKELTPPKDAAAGKTSSVAPIPGAVVPIHYAIALLQQKRVAWEMGTQDSGAESTGARPDDSSLPRPLSLVPAPYPWQSLFGGEVVLDALVGKTGTLSDVRVVRGDEPFLQKALDAVHTWTFVPASAKGNPTEARIMIEFQFPQPYIPPRAPTVHEYDETSDSPRDEVAVPTTTVEPEYPSEDTEGSVILYERIDAEGKLESVEPVLGADRLTQAALSAAKKWRFLPARRAGAAIDSTAIVVVVLRRPAETNHSHLK